MKRLSFFIALTLIVTASVTLWPSARQGRAIDWPSTSGRLTRARRGRLPRTIRSSQSRQTHRALRGDLRCRNQPFTNWGGRIFWSEALQQGGEKRV